MSESRPVYETEQTREREAEIAGAASAALGFTMHRAPRYYPCDFSFLNERRLAALAEVKVRDKRYRSYMISLHKTAALISMAAIVKVWPLLVVCWESERQLGICHLDTCPKTGSIGGRSDRDDTQDIEPVVLIPIDAFQIYELANISWLSA